MLHSEIMLLTALFCADKVKSRGIAVKKAAVEVGGLSKQVSGKLSVFQHAFFARELCHAFLQLFERPYFDLANAFTADIVLT